MNKQPWILLVLILALAAFSQACTQSTPAPTPSPTATQPDPLKSPNARTTSVPDARLAAQAYLDAWAAEDYASMYPMLTSLSQAAISAEDFEKYYRSIANEAALESIQVAILSSLVMNPTSAQVGYRVTLDSILVGELERESVMQLTLEQGQWRVQWDDTLVMPELANDNYLGMERYIPARANIYDRYGHALVAPSDATAIGLRPALMDEDQIDALYAVLTRLTGMSADEIQDSYADVPPGADWYVALGEAPASEVEQRFGDLSGYSGLVLNYSRWRYYFDGGVAAHLLGYVSPIQAGQEDEYLRQGYRIDERVGQAGLEQWGEPYLSGTRGGALYLFNNQNQIVTKLAEKPAGPAEAIYTTLDRDFQTQVQRAIDGFRGAIVVLERDTGRVLAMASSPTFDPNAFEPNNYNYSAQLAEIYENPYNPLINRAAQGQYPLGSVFKIITMAAGLESGRFTPESTYQCGYFFTELPGLRLNDWTYDHFQEDGETIPSGLLTLPEGLIRSCNPWFWHIGLDLYVNDLTTAVSDMARGFGLGQPTGIEGVFEEGGNIPDPASEVDATNLAIGQGDTLVTPLQVAAFTAAIGNGGTLYRPQVIEKIQPPEGDPRVEFKVEVNGTLPVSLENIKIIQNAMRGVVASRTPFGTAWHRFTGLDIPVFGKTGTAQSGSGRPHAWFSGYTAAGREDRPDIAIAVVVENIGEGSDYAAPIFRRVVELYYYDRPAKLYPWESSFYVVATPEPEEP